MTVLIGETSAPTESISQEVLESRLARVREWMKESDADALVVYGAPGVLGSRTLTAGYVRYLTGWTTTALPAMLVVPREGTPTVITMGPHDTRAFALAASWFGNVIAAGAVDRYPEAVGSALRAITGSGHVATAGVGEMAGPLYQALLDQLAGHKRLDAQPAIDQLRLVRHPEEVRMHRIGASISDSMITAAMEQAVLPGMSGPKLMADIEHAGRALGADTSATWLATGEKPVTTYMEQSELAGSIGANDRVQLGTTLSYRGYFAQGLRIGVRGKPSARLREYADILIEIQDAALAAMRPGALLHEVSDVIESAIDRHCPYTREKDPFRFQSCHGLGLSYVEPGMARDLNARRDKTLDPAGVRIEPGMVIEVHPNFTVPDLGHVCAGDMALVTEHGGEWLTAFPRGLHQL
ncbi:M24 family metallopeptidase [Streptomyces sp. NPDC046821]|uniref:M24 family metallopeptidase n=1 Tax=Streptomyces sp. NPDC046821 TaxID=3154702 RepID=UPI00340E4CBB